MKREYRPVVFVWFGALKVLGVTPVDDFLAGTLPWLGRAWLMCSARSCHWSCNPKRYSNAAIRFIAAALVLAARFDRQRAVAVPATRVADTRPDSRS